VQKTKWITVFAAWLLAAASLLAQAAPQAVGTGVADMKNDATLDALQEKRAFESLMKLMEKEITSTVDAMPADKFGFAPTDGEFKGVQTFGQMVKHLSATNHILAAAALGENPPADAGDELGPENVRTKAEILSYLKGSFVNLDKAVEAIGQTKIPVNASPVSPLKGGDVTRLALITEALLHAYDHYGQMVEYLRMNGVVPPASRP
jgi:DinB superfamily